MSDPPTVPVPASAPAPAAAPTVIPTAIPTAIPTGVTGLPPYDDGNVFARILRGEIPSRRVYEDEWALAFHDIAPQAPVHVLVIPRGRYCSLADFCADAPAEAVAGFWRAVGRVARELGLEAGGYRALTNMGPEGGQEVGHFHVHLFGGRRLGRMVPGLG